MTIKFESGKTYQNHEVTARTACFVTFAGLGKKKIVTVDDVETVNFPATTTINSFGAVIRENPAITLTAIVESPVNKSLPCDIEVYESLVDTETETIITDGKIDWKLVSVDHTTKICRLEAYREPREIGYAPRTAQIHVHVLQSIMGWDNEDDDDDFKITEPDPIDDQPSGFISVSHSRGWAHGTTWRDGIPELEILGDNFALGYAMAEPIWFERTDDISNEEHFANMAAIDDIRMRDARMNDRQADMYECRLLAY